jgi:hypothetical protein
MAEEIRFASRGVDAAMYVLGGQTNLVMFAIDKNGAVL